MYRHVFLICLIFLARAEDKFSKSLNQLEEKQIISTMESPIKTSKQLDFQWDTLDPFLFCVHHKDNYPPGNEKLGLNPDQLRGRNLGSDFRMKDGFRMYHGKTVPGFPAHPHRGFETVTVVLNGLIDHSDSLQCQGRYGNGDVQWMTAGRGVQHCEMFPLINSEEDNPLELFQIWLNLPAANKMVDPDYKMLWREDIPIVQLGEEGERVTLRIIAGNYEDTIADECAPNSWAHDEENQVTIFTIDMDAGTTWSIPVKDPEVNRYLYFYEGDTIKIAGKSFSKLRGIILHADRECVIEMGETSGKLLLLEGRPINEPVAQHGPFVMNTREEIMQTFMEFQQTQFGGWHWPSSGPTLGKNQGRFAIHPNGEREERD